MTTFHQLHGVAGAAMADVATPSPGLSRDLARSQGTDFFAMDDLLTEQDRAVRNRVRAFAAGIPRTAVVTTVGRGGMSVKCREEKCAVFLADNRPGGGWRAP